jgi:methylmalonyl-CoA mutase
VLELSGVPEEGRRSFLTARTSDRMLAGIDPWSNMLRATTAGFAAAVGGAEGLTVTPFDAVVADAVGAAAPGGLGRRIARNTQLVLQEESALRRVADPAGGSWYVESLTDAMAREAWAKVTEIEAAGGALQVATDGTVASDLAEQAERRRGELARRKREMTGVNVFPLLADDGVHPEPADRSAFVRTENDRLGERGALPDGALDRPSVDDAAGDQLLAHLLKAAEAGARVDELATLAGWGPVTDLDATGLPTRRDAEPFEQLRAAAAGPAGGAADAGADEASSAAEAGVGGAEVTEDGPRVFLAGLGPLAAHAAQATWAQNFFGVGGLATVQSEPLDDPAKAGEALKADGAILAAVAGGPKAEDDALQAAIASLKDAGAKVVYLVGGNDEKARSLGADRGVKQGVDLLEILEGALAVLDRPVATTRTETAR